MIRLVIADDDPLVRQALAVLLGAEPDMTVAGVAADGLEVVYQARLHRPAVILMDVRMPGHDGVAATRLITGWPEPRPRVLVLTTFDQDEVVDRAIRAGADGFLLKRAAPAEIVAAVRTVAGGEGLLAPTVTRRLMGILAARPDDPGDHGLTGREAEVLRALAEGRSNAEIAEAVNVSVETVKTHLKAILTKLGVRDRTQAVVWAYRSGFIRR
ncbi:response regulator [Herbidospora cretacea]|uniref:response regulator n=1 Tax=Herbidospora cretacea TaxID=28444 RepID=UPI000773EA4B|nr:response regulator transcription factor [Herbidospora cretacea]